MPTAACWHDAENCIAPSSTSGVTAEWKRASDHPVHAGHFHSAAAHVHLKLGMVDECLEDYRQAIEISRRNHVFPQLGQALKLYAETLMMLGRDQEARAALEEAVQVFADPRRSQL